MWFRLALALGMSVREAQQRITAREFVEWVAFYRIAPWGEDRADLRSAIVAATIANVNRTRHSPSVPIDRFLPKFGNRDGGSGYRTRESAMAALKALAMIHGKVN